MATQTFSEKDGTIKIVAIHSDGSRHTLEVSSQKDAKLECGDTSTAVKAAGEVVFIAQGAAGPKFSFACVNGATAASIRRHCQDPRTDPPTKYTLEIVWVFRRAGMGSLAFDIHGAMLSKGGDVSAADADGLKGESFEFLARKVKTSTNGGKYLGYV